MAVYVLKESAELALSWVKTHAYDVGVANKSAQDPLRIPDATIDLRLHLPAGERRCRHGVPVDMVSGDSQ